MQLIALELSCQVAAVLVGAVGIGTRVYFEAVEVGAVGVSAMVPVGDGAVVVAAGDFMAMGCDRVVVSALLWLELGAMSALGDGVVCVAALGVKAVSSSVMERYWL